MRIEVNGPFRGLAGTPHLFEIFQQDLARMQSEIQRSFADAAPVILLTPLLGDEDIRALCHTQRLITFRYQMAKVGI